MPRPPCVPGIADAASQAMNLQQAVGPAISADVAAAAALGAGWHAR